MARIKRGVTAHARHKKILKMAKGYRGRSATCFRIALQRVEKALQYAHRDRRNRKREFRALWIQRINAAVRLQGLTYGQFIHGIQYVEETKSLGLVPDRKVLADMAVRAPASFSALVEKVKKVLPSIRLVSAPPAAA